MDWCDVYDDDEDGDDDVGLDWWQPAKERDSWCCLFPLLLLFACLTTTTNINTIYTI